MPDGVVSALKLLLSTRAPSLNKLVLTWFGGEPLLAESVLETISLHVLDLCKTFPNLDYSASVTTNGYTLDLDRLSRLVSWGIRDYQISLDGPREHHDRTRIRANGKGSFDVIRNNLLAFRNSDIDARVMLRLHITPDNLDVMPDFVAELRDTFLVDSRFSILFMPVAKLGGPNDARFDVLNHSETLNIIRGLMAIARAYHDDQNRSAMPCAPSEQDVCYASKPNSFVIRADGRLAKCTVGFDAPSNQIGKLSPDGTLELHHDRLKEWFAGWRTQDWGHLSCPKEAFFDREIETDREIPAETTLVNIIPRTSSQRDTGVYGDRR